MDSFPATDQQSGQTDIEPVQDLSELYELAVDSMQTGASVYADQFKGEDLPVMATLDDVLDQTVEEPFVDYAGDVRTDAPLSDLFAALNDIGEEYGVENMAYDAASDAIETYISDIGPDVSSDSMDPLLADMAAGMGMETETTDMIDVEALSLDADPISSEIFDQQLADFELTEDMGHETADSYMLMSQDSAAIDALRDFHTDMLSYIGRHEVLLDMEDTNRLTFVLDDVIESAFPVNLNYGIVSGEVVREWHSEDPKKQFYLITVKAGDSFFTVTYFDKMMELSPRAGDQVRMLTQIQTDKKEIVDAKDSIRKMAYYTTIVARTVMKITSDPPHSDEAA